MYRYGRAIVMKLKLTSKDILEKEFKKEHLPNGISRIQDDRKIAQKWMRGICFF